MGRPKKTQEEWLEEVKKNHGDQYDYSKTVYTGNRNPVTIICKKHGEFTMIASEFHRGNNCPMCAREGRRVSFEDYVERAKKVHDIEYIYHKEDFEGDFSKRKIRITCPKHGDFIQDKMSHLKGADCPKCFYERQQNQNKSSEKLTSDFIERARRIHGDKYDYSKVVYKTAREKVCIICPEHGEFWQTPDVHLRKKYGCPKCALESIIEKNSSTVEEFVEKARKIHGNKYDYSKVVYKNSREKVCIICPEHGEFWQIPMNHLRKKYGCPKCGLEKCIESNTMSTEDFIKRATEVHHGKYDYSVTKYKSFNENIEYICHEKDKFGNEHGIIQQKATIHLMGSGCRKCNSSHLEVEVENLLKNSGIKYTPQKHFKWLGMQSLDFYLDDYNIAIECQGEQHYRPIRFFGGDENLIYVKKNDEKKLKLCKDNGIEIIYYSHFDDDNESCRTEEQLLETIGKYKK